MKIVLFGVKKRNNSIIIWKIREKYGGNNRSPGKCVLKLEGSDYEGENIAQKSGHAYARGGRNMTQIRGKIMHEG